MQSGCITPPYGSVVASAGRLPYGHDGVRKDLREGHQPRPQLCQLPVSWAAPTRRLVQPRRGSGVMPRMTTVLGLVGMGWRHRPQPATALLLGSRTPVGHPPPSWVEDMEGTDNKV
jgi:hypothetical protein